MVKISNIGSSKIGFVKPCDTAKVQKKDVQTFQPAGKTDYTHIVRNDRFAATIVALNEKFQDVDAQEYVDAALHNGNNLLSITDADYENFGAKWDTCEV